MVTSIDSAKLQSRLRFHGWFPEADKDPSKSCLLVPLPKSVSVDNEVEVWLGSTNATLGTASHISSIDLQGMKGRYVTSIIVDF